MAQSQAAGNKAPDKSQSIWSMSFVILIVISFFQSMGQMMMNTLIPLRAYDLGATAQVVGIVTSAFGIAALSLRPFVSPAFDSFSKKRILIASLTVMTLATILYSVSSSVELLIASRLVHGFGMACAAPVALAIVGSMLPTEKMSSGIAIYGVAFVVAQCVGPAFALWLMESASFKCAFLAATAMLTSACIIALLLKENRAEKRKPYKLSLASMFAKQAIVPAIIAGAITVTFACVQGFVVIFGNLQGVGSMGLYFTVYAALMVGTRPLFGILSDKVGSNIIISLSLILFSLSVLLVARADSLVDFMVAAAVGACGFGSVSPLLQSACIVSAPAECRGAAVNTYFTGVDVGFLVGPVIGGSIASAFTEAGVAEAASYSYMYYVLIIPILAALLLFLINARVRSRSACMRADDDISM